MLSVKCKLAVLLNISLSLSLSCCCQCCCNVILIFSHIQCDDFICEIRNCNAGMHVERCVMNLKISMCVFIPFAMLYAFPLVYSCFVLFLHFPPLNDRRVLALLCFCCCCRRRWIRRYRCCRAGGVVGWCFCCCGFIVFFNIFIFVIIVE